MTITVHRNPGASQIPKLHTKRDSFSIALECTALIAATLRNKYASSGTRGTQPSFLHGLQGQARGAAPVSQESVLQHQRLLTHGTHRQAAAALQEGMLKAGHLLQSRPAAPSTSTKPTAASLGGHLTLNKQKQHSQYYATESCLEQGLVRVPRVDCAFRPLLSPHGTKHQPVCAPPLHPSPCRS